MCFYVSYYFFFFLSVFPPFPLSPVSPFPPVLSLPVVTALTWYWFLLACLSNLCCMLCLRLPPSLPLTRSDLQPYLFLLHLLSLHSLLSLVTLVLLDGSYRGQLVSTRQSHLLSSCIHSLFLIYRTPKGDSRLYCIYSLSAPLSVRSIEEPYPTILLVSYPKILLSNNQMIFDCFLVFRGSVLASIILILLYSYNLVIVSHSDIINYR